MKKLFGALIVGTMVFGAVMASAATLNVQGGVIQEGTLANVSCQSDPVSVGYVTNATGNSHFSVDGVILTGLNTTCNGKTFAIAFMLAPCLSGCSQVAFMGGTLPNPITGPVTLMGVVGGNVTWVSGEWPHVLASDIGQVQILIKDGAL